MRMRTLPERLASPAGRVRHVAGDVDARIVRVGRSSSSSLGRPRQAPGIRVRPPRALAARQATSAGMSRRERRVIRSDGFIDTIIMPLPLPSAFPRHPCPTAAETIPARTAAPLAAAGAGLARLHLAPASADASFRRYFRVGGRDRDTVVAMDAPPDKEDVEPYLRWRRCSRTSASTRARAGAQRCRWLPAAHRPRRGDLPGRTADPGRAEVLYRDAIGHWCRSGARRQHAHSLPRTTSACCASR